MRVMMVQCNSEFKSTHLLLVIIKNGEIAVNSIVLCDQMEQWNAHVSKSDVVLPINALVITVPHALLGLDVVPDFEDSSLRLQVVEDFRVHLHWKLVGFPEDRVQAVIKHPCALLAVRELFLQLRVFIEH